MSEVRKNQQNRVRRTTNNGQRVSNKKRRKKKKQQRINVLLGMTALILLALIILVLVSRESGSNNKNADKNIVGTSGNDLNISVKEDDKTTNDANNNDTDKNNETTEQSGSNQEETTAEQTLGGDRVNFATFTISDSLRNLNADCISLGYDKNSDQRDSGNRPMTIVNIENTYSEKCGAKFVGAEGKKEICITFTSGYEQIDENGIANTDKLMNLLKEKNVPAIFFVDGGYSNTQPELCKRIVDNGFILGCHGYAHPSDGMATHSVEEQLEDAKKIYDRLYELTGVEPRYYRPDSGVWNERSLTLLKELGFSSIMYSFAYYDYDPNDQPDPTATLQMFIDNIHNGEIMYLHTVSNTNVSILGQFIDKARDLGYEFTIIE